MKTIAVVNAKGGVGKTTIATSLASALAWEGYGVALGDLDVQKSATDWLALRPEDYPPISGLDPDQGPVRAPAGTDFLILDTHAALAGNELGAIVRRSDIILIPLLPSPVDMRAAQRFLGHLFKLKPVADKKVKVGLIANRVKSYTIIFRELKGFLEDYRAPFVAQFRASMNYVRAAERGLGVADLPPYLAWQDWEEWEALLKWLRR